MSDLNYRRCSACGDPMVSGRRTRDVLCDGCDAPDVFDEAAAERKRAAKQARASMERIQRVGENARCSTPECPCHRAIGAR